MVKEACTRHLKHIPYKCATFIKSTNSDCLGKLSLEKRFIQRYITKHPKLQASKDLQKILLRLTSTKKLKMVDDYLVGYKKKRII